MSVDPRYRELFEGNALAAAIVTAFEHVVKLRGHVTLWYGFESHANDFFALSEIYDETTINHILDDYARVAATPDNVIESVRRVVFIASFRGKIGRHSHQDYDFDTFLTHADRLLQVKDDPVRAFEIMMDALAFHLYLHMRGYDSNIGAVFSEFTRASRTSPKLRGSARILRRLMGTPGAYALAYNEFQHWTPTTTKQVSSYTEMTNRDEIDAYFSKT